MRVDGLSERDRGSVNVCQVGVGLELGILGPFEVRLNGSKPLAVGGLRQRALLAILLLHANEVVSTDRLVDQLWGERPPATAVHTVQVFVSRLRGALKSAGDRLVTVSPGYVIEVGIDEIDADRCERSYGSARRALAAGDPTRALACLQEAEELWRGAPLADFTYEPFAQAMIARLEELRISCREERIEAELALGRHAKVVSELEALVREQPFRERPRGQLMLALYRCGRQAEALEAFQQARRMLVDELAVQPSEALRDLEQAILRQDPSLKPESAPEQRSGADTPPEQRSGADTPPEHAVADPQSRRASIGVTDLGSGSMVRKTVTLLVATLVWRGPEGRSDPEVARGWIAEAREQAQQIVVRHGGAFASGLGGEVVGVFGLPLTREDDALRAVRAADELRSRVAILGRSEPGELVVRVGIDTGEVVAEGPSDLVGEPLSGGISLQRAAGDAEVLISDATRRLVSDVIRIESALSGTAWRLVGLMPTAPARHRRLVSTMVGRDHELAAARAALHRAADARSSHLLTVIGEAGIGKSRLAQELVDLVAGEATVLTGRCLSYGEGVAFWPLREALTQAAGGESRDAIRGLLGDADDAQLVADIIAATLGLADVDNRGEQVPWAFRRLLEQLARDRPVIVLIEDVHWAQRPLLELVDHLIDWLAAPVLLLCLTRPELLEVRPGWGGGHLRVSSLVLGPLSDEDALRLLDDQLGERSLRAGERDQILHTAEGNPLFVEQLLAMSVDDPWWDREREIPPTIQSLIAARLDRLGPGERGFIERAAVIGREFWLDAVVELLPAEARASAGQYLHALVHRGFIEPARSTLSGENLLRFHHILVRDVAYRGTPKTVRGDLHELFADWIERREGGHDEFVGYHLEQAFHYRSEVGRQDDHVLTLAQRAGECLGVAGGRALSLGDANTSVKLLRRSSDLFEASGSSRPGLQLDLGSALSESGDFPNAERVLQATLEQAEDSRSEVLSARAMIELSYVRSRMDPNERVGEMLTVAEGAIAVFERAGDDGGLSRAWLHVAFVHWIRCRCAEMEEALERALTYAESAGERRQRSRILSDLARATVIGPRPVDDGITRCQSILERADDDDVVLTAVTETMLAVLEAMDGRFADARERWARSKRRLLDVGLSVTVAALQMYCAFIEILAGTPHHAELELDEAYAVLEPIGERGHLVTTAALLARLLYAQGRHDESERYSRICEETASDEDVVSQVLWRGTRAKVLALAGKTRRAEELVDSAVALAHETDFLMLHADALRDRADVRTILNRPDHAAQDAAQAKALYERKGIRILADETPSIVRRSLV